MDFFHCAHGSAGGGANVAIVRCDGGWNIYEADDGFVVALRELWAGVRRGLYDVRNAAADIYLRRLL